MDILELKQKINQILNLINEEKLTNLIAEAILVFDKLDKSKQYYLAFSGGKDSHVLLAIYLLYKKIFKVNNFDCIILFSDTRLETDDLYQLIVKIEKFLKDKEIIERVYPENNYWYYQFVYGYPVPTNFNRWCTNELKVKPMKKSKKIAITGRHLGESKNRDETLKKENCSSGECGIDKVKQSIDPLLHFRDCDIWDLLFYTDNSILYNGVLNTLKQTYNGKENKRGSLRMGCFMCPVVGISTIAKNNDIEGLEIRKTLEKLRKARRINSQKTKNLGAIYIEDRRVIWNELNKEILLRRGFISEQEIKEIDELLKTECYPKTYKKEWISSEHKRLLKQPNQLSFF